MSDWYLKKIKMKHDTCPVIENSFKLPGFKIYKTLLKQINIIYIKNKISWEKNTLKSDIVGYRIY